MVRAAVAGWARLAEVVLMLMRFGGGAGRLCGAELLYELASSRLRAKFRDLECPLHWATFTTSSQFPPGSLPGFGVQELRE